MKNWMIGIGVLALVLGGLFLMGYITLPGDDQFNIDITCYDKDGNELGTATTRLAILGISREGFDGDIHSVKVEVDFQVTTNIDYKEVNTICYLEVVTRINTQGAGIVHTLARHQIGGMGTTLNDTFADTILMSELLPVNKITDAGKEVGWGMTFTADVETTIIKQDGTAVEADDTCAITLTLIWVEDEVKVDSYIRLP